MHHTTPVDYEDWLRGEVVEQSDAENPFDILESQSRTAELFIYSNWLRWVWWFVLSSGTTSTRPIVPYPEKDTTEYFTKSSCHTTDLTDERDALLIGNEMR